MYDRFLEILYEKYPKRIQLVHKLTDLLFIEREAVYRRLRKDVNFSIQEIAKIALTWDISLDRLIDDANREQVPFQMRLVNFLSPTEDDLDFLRTGLQYINYTKTSGHSEYMDICNRLPKSLVTGFKELYRFDLFRWAYEYGSNEYTEKLFSQSVIPAKILKMMSEYFQAIKNVSSMNYIWDYMLLDYLIRDIQYFHSILMITDDEKELIRQDLYALMDYLFEIVSGGYFPETGNEVNFYISRVNIDTNYSYLYTKDVKICRIHAFNKYEVYTLDAEMTDKFRTWMQLKKRSSIPISKVNKKERIDFFTRQRQLIDNLE